ncbi:hypothetical protein PF003_g8322 [Phytophthora fragariae]|nr:hypothetical protein PF003_g8322 [Phytophthora fragariae]
MPVGGDDVLSVVDGSSDQCSLAPCCQEDAFGIAS